MTANICEHGAYADLCITCHPTDCETVRAAFQPARCHICDRTFAKDQGLRTHLSLAHYSKGVFDRPARGQAEIAGYTYDLPADPEASPVTRYGSAELCSTRLYNGTTCGRPATGTYVDDIGGIVRPACARHSSAADSLLTRTDGGW